MKTCKTFGRFGFVAALFFSGYSLLGALMGCGSPTGPTNTGEPHKWVVRPSVDLSGKWKGTGSTSISPLVTLSMDISHDQKGGVISGTYTLNRNSATTNGEVVANYVVVFWMRLFNQDSTTCLDDFSLSPYFPYSHVGTINADTMDLHLSGTDCLGEHKDGSVLLVRM